VTVVLSTAPGSPGTAAAEAASRQRLRVGALPRGRRDRGADRRGRLHRRGPPAGDGAHLAAAPRLKGVVKHGVGTANIDVAACTSRGVPVQNAPGANADT
jgi:hypothetical protein